MANYPRTSQSACAKSTCVVYANNTYHFNVLYHLYLYLIFRLQITPLLHNGVKMTSKRRSLILFSDIDKQMDIEI